MAIASIIFQQNADGYTTPCSRDDLVLSLPVTVLNNDNSGATSWLWTITDKPDGSIASLVSPTSSTTTFTPDIVGTYLIKLVINAGASFNQRGAAIKTAKLHYRIPAATETTEFDAYKGWAPAVDLALRLLDDGYAPSVAASTLQAVYNASNPSSFTLNNTNNGFQIHDNSTPIGVNLFEVDAYGNGTKYLAINSASSTFVGQLLQTGGKVGLGTITPGAGYTNLIPDLSVHIYKAGHNMLLVDTGFTAAVDSGLVLYTNSTNNNAAIFLDESDSQKLKFALGIVDSDTTRNSNTKLTIKQDGSVGIGTSSPSYGLDVVGTGHFTGHLTLDLGLDMGGVKITSLGGPPTSGTDAVNKTYADSLLTGVVTSVATDSSLTGGPITTTGTLGLNLTHTNNWIAVQNFDSNISIDGYLINAANATVGDSLVYDGYAFTPALVSSGASILIHDNSNLLLTTTFATNVISNTPANNGDFVVFVYYRVVSSSNLTIDITWTDGYGAQIFNALPLTLESAGSVSIAPLYITATTATPIIVTATAGTANQVYISATSMALNSSANTDIIPAVTEEANVFDYTLAITSPVNVLAFTPVFNKNFMVYLYYRVTSGTTNITIDLLFNDISGSQILSILPLTSKIIGSYSVAPVYIQATNGAPITVQITAGIANNVHVSATIMKV